MSGENHFLAHRQHLLVGTSHGRRGEGALWGLLQKGTNPFLTVPASPSHRLPKAPPPQTLTPRVRIRTYEFWGTEHSVHTTPSAGKGAPKQDAVNSRNNIFFSSCHKYKENVCQVGEDGREAAAKGLLPLRLGSEPNVSSTSKT